MTKNVDLLTHSPKYRVGEFDVDPTRYPRGKWGFSNKNPTSGPPTVGFPRVVLTLVQSSELPTPSGRGLTQKRVLPSLTPTATKITQKSTSRDARSPGKLSPSKSRSKSPSKNKTVQKQSKTVIIAFQSRHERVQHEFKVGFTLQQVLDFFKEKLHLPVLLVGNTFVNGVPRKQFKQSDRLKTLEDLGVIERTAFLYQD